MLGERCRSVILDDFGLEPLDAGARHDLLEILEERYARRSTIVTSQLPLSAWHEVIGDPTYADAILDRLVHNAHRIELTGESLRRTRGKQQTGSMDCALFEEGSRFGAEAQLKPSV